MLLAATGLFIFPWTFQLKLRAGQGKGMQNRPADVRGVRRAPSRALGGPAAGTGRRAAQDHGLGWAVRPPAPRFPFRQKRPWRKGAQASAGLTSCGGPCPDEGRGTVPGLPRARVLLGRGRRKEPQLLKGGASPRAGRPPVRSLCRDVAGGARGGLLCLAFRLRVISMQCSPGMSQAARCRGVGPAALE